MIWAVLASQAMEHATKEEVAAIKADGRLRFEAYRAAVRTDQALFDIREREGLLSEGETRPEGCGHMGADGEPLHVPEEYDATARGGKEEVK